MVRFALRDRTTRLWSPRPCRPGSGGRRRGLVVSLSGYRPGHHQPVGWPQPRNDRPVIESVRWASSAPSSVIAWDSALSDRRVRDRRRGSPAQPRRSGPPRVADRVEPPDGVRAAADTGHTVSSVSTIRSVACSRASTVSFRSVAVVQRGTFVSCLPSPVGRSVQ